MKKAVSILVLIALVLTLIPVTFAASSATTNRENSVFAGYVGGVAQYVKIGDDMNGLVGVSSSDSNPVPSYAKYTNGFYVQGAQLRVTTSGQSAVDLRFIIVNNLDMITTMRNAGLKNISYGALVEIDTGANLNIKNSVEKLAENIYQEQRDLGTDYQKYTVCVEEIDAQNMRDDIAVRPYLTYTDLSGDTHTLYGEQYRCDLYSLAYDAYYYGNETTAVKNALESKVLTAYNGSTNYALSGEYKLNATQTRAFINTWRRTTNSRIEEIKNTPNIEIPEGATVYYVSNNGNNNNDGKSPATAWKTLSKVNEADLQPGDYVLFERGGYFRGDKKQTITADNTLGALNAKAGVTYSAYGTGDKPVISASAEQGAVASRWKEIQDNVWEYTPKTETGLWNDVGSMVFTDAQGNETYATKMLVYKDAQGNWVEYKTRRSVSSSDLYSVLQNDLEFIHDNSVKYTYRIYLYSEQNPGERFESIEFLQNKRGIYIDGNNVTIDNLTIKYAGAHGIGAGTRTGLTVQNCTFEWIGGSVASVKPNSTTGEETPVRFGNGVEIYGGCDDYEVSNCYFYQIYDAAVTHQFNLANDSEPKNNNDYSHKNVLFKDNVMEYCAYSIEFFLGKDTNTNNPSYYDNIVYEGNIMWYAGEGLGSQRPDESQPAHIKGWNHVNDVKNFTIKNNFAAYSTSMLIHSGFRNKLSTKGVQLLDNVFVGVEGQKLGFFGYRCQENSWGSFEKLNYKYGSTQNKIQGSGSQNVIANGNRYYFVTK